MNKLLIVGLAAVTYVAASAAQAADLRMPVKAPPVAPPVPVFSWTGCYIGGHVGGGWGRKDFSNPDIALFAPGGESFRTSGWLAGGQVGCDYQVANNWVIGVENQGSWANIKGDHADSFTIPGVRAVDATVHAKTEWLASITGRLGLTWDRWLVYGKGGVAFAGDKYGFDGQVRCLSGLCIGPNPAFFNFSASETRVGWTVGGGVEWALVPNWSAKVEYQYYDFGRHRVGFFDSIGDLLSVSGLPVDVTQKIQTIKFGLNYHLWTSSSPPPVGARY